MKIDNWEKYELDKKYAPLLAYCVAALTICIVSLACLLIWGVTKSEGASDIPHKQAIRCLMGEARGEGLTGMVAVGEVLRRRNTTKGMYGCQAEFKSPQWVYDLAAKAWAISETSNITNGATHFESTDFPVPYWAKDMKLVAHIGKHKFYKEKK